MAGSSHKHPGLGHWLLHIRKTFRLIGALLRDPQVAFIRKFLFVATMLIFCGLLIIPDSFIVAALGLALPIISPVVGVPAGLIDIAAVAFVSYGLLRFFPRAAVEEHAVALYGPAPDISPHTR